MLESLIAFLIAAGGLAAVYSSNLTSLQGGERAESRLRAVLVAEDVLARAGLEYPLVESMSAGKSGAVSWSMRIERAPDDASSLTGLWRVAVTAKARNGMAVSLESLRFRPETS